jgi:uncharacterized protein YqhQ
MRSLDLAVILVVVGFPLFIYVLFKTKTGFQMWITCICALMILLPASQGVGLAVKKYIAYNKYQAQEHQIREYRTYVD